MKLQTYDDIRVTYEALSGHPAMQIYKALTLSMQTKSLEASHDLLADERRQFNLIRALVHAGHSNPLEHIYYTMHITGVSRACMAQITRHRTLTCTCSSQHYSDYRDMPFSVSPMYADQLAASLEAAVLSYVDLVDETDVSVYEARQVLPNASTVNIMITANCSAWLQTFRTRSCKRNVPEMRILMEKIKAEFLVAWPAFGKCLGPHCYYDRDCKCNQGRLTCGQPVAVSIHAR